MILNWRSQRYRGGAQAFAVGFVLTMVGVDVVPPSVADGDVIEIPAIARVIHMPRRLRP